MTETTAQTSAGIEGLTAEIVSAYVSNNAIPTTELPGLIQMVRSALSSAGTGAVPQQTTKLTPAEIKKTITSEGLISFLDGKPYKTLKRHLTKNGVTFEQYKARFGLPVDYPITSPAYSAKRSQIAKDLGLGNPARGAAA